MQTLYLYLVWKSCMCTLYGNGVFAYFMCTLYAHIVCTHCKCTLYVYLVYFLVYVYCVCSVHKSNVHTRWSAPTPGTSALKLTSQSLTSSLARATSRIRIGSGKPSGGGFEGHLVMIFPGLESRGVGWHLKPNTTGQTGPGDKKIVKVA